MEITKRNTKSNDEIRSLWEKHSYKSLKRLDLSDHYSTLFIGGRFDLKDIFKQFGLKPNDVFESERKEVNKSLNKIDRLLKRGIRLLEGSVKRVYFRDIDPQDLLKEHESVISGLTTIYIQIQDQLRLISFHINYKDYGLTFPTLSDG